MNTLITSIIIIIGLIVIVSFLLIINLLNKLKSLNSPNESIGVLNQNLIALEQRLHSSNQNISQRLDNATHVINSITRELGQIQQLGTQLKDFQNLLRSPKLRGNLGEQGLKDLLSQVLPTDLFKFQYRFNSGVVVDAIIRIDSGIIPIDAKFPLENFNKYLSSDTPENKLAYLKAFRVDTKKHIDDIAQKYIKTDEGTIDFAFMYLPSESIFFEMINNPNLHDLYQHATNKKIIIASPSTFLYYLRTIMLGLEGRRINEMSQQILTVLQALRIQNNKFGDNLSTLNRHITHAKSSMDSVQNEYNQLANKLNQVSVIKEAYDESKQYIDSNN